MKKHLFLLILFIVTLLSFYKLDFPYFFTDEILYVQEGFDNINGSYEQNLQVPFLAKYIAGYSFSLFSYNVFALRAVFTFIFLLFIYFLFRFLDRLYGEKYALLGSLLYFFGVVNFESNRMVMLEAPMHLFWILFLYFYYQTFVLEKNKLSNRLFLIIGLFLGLSLITKFTSLVLIIFILLGIFYQKKVLSFEKKFLFSSYSYVFLSSGLVFIFSYLHYFYSQGLIEGIKQILKFIKDTYLQRNIEGKVHLVDGEVFNKSPIYSYLVNSLNTDGIFRTGSTLLSLLSLKNLKRISFNTIFFGTFFLLNFLLFILLSLHNERYLSTLWIPLVFLIIEGVKNINIAEIKKYWLLTMVVLISAFIFFNYLINLKPTKYHALYLYFKEVTNDFKTKERMYSYGSVRSLTWYRRYLPDEDLFLYRRDYKIMSSEFPTFKYFSFDNDELKKISPLDNELYRYIEENEDKFEKIETDFNFTIFKRIAD